MEKRDEYFNMLNKVIGYAESPYFNKDAVKDLVRVFERFVNNLANDHEVVAAGTEFATDEMVMDLLKERGITIPATVEEAQNRRIETAGAELAGLHRTLQQTFMRLVMTFIRVQAAAYEAEIYDLRNESTCRLSHAMWQAVKDRDDLYLPLV